MIGGPFTIPFLGAWIGEWATWGTWIPTYNIGKYGVAFWGLDNNNGTGDDYFALNSDLNGDKAIIKNNKDRDDVKMRRLKVGPCNTVNIGPHDQNGNKDIDAGGPEGFVANTYCDPI